MTPGLDITASNLGIANLRADNAGFFFAFVHCVPSADVAYPICAMRLRVPSSYGPYSPPVYHISNLCGPERSTETEPVSAESHSPVLPNGSTGSFMTDHVTPSS